MSRLVDSHQSIPFTSNGLVRFATGAVREYVSKGFTEDTTICCQCGNQTSNLSQPVAQHLGVVAKLLTTKTDLTSKATTSHGLHPVESHSPVGDDVEVVGHLVEVDLRLALVDEATLQAVGADRRRPGDRLAKVRKDGRPTHRLQPLQLSRRLHVEALKRSQG